MSEYEQPIGAPVPEWAERPRPSRSPLEGTFCRLEPLDAALHGEQLYEAFGAAPDSRGWTYIPAGPFDFSSSGPFLEFVSQKSSTDDPLFFAVVDLVSQRAVGMMSYMRINPGNGSIEVGYILFSELLQRTRAATEAQYLLMRRAFDELGYRRYEWKCDSLNTPSCKAASRLGFQREGTHRQAVVYKGRNRDTTWFSILDSEWPPVRAAFDQWLASENFDGDGQQLRGLADLIQEAKASYGG